MTFQENLQRLMESNNLNLASFAEEVGTTASSISRYLNGVRKPEYDTLIKIAERFDVTLDWLCGIQTNRYATLPPEIRDLIDKYQVASASDKELIDTILKKYKIDG